MHIIPAIDLIDGKCVRLIQGQYNRRITYNDSAAAQAQDFISQGARWIHIVDLDGAKAGKIINIDAIASILAASRDKAKIEIGGGIRNEQAIKQLLDMGAERIIIGTKAFYNFKWFSRMADKFTGKLVLGLDAKGFDVAVQGWTKQFDVNLLDFAAQAAKLPIAAIIYTNITKDGMMTGPDFEKTSLLADSVNVPVIASGGINSLEDIKKLAQLGNIEAAIIGRSLYEGAIKLADAIKAAEV